MKFFRRITACLLALIFTACSAAVPAEAASTYTVKVPVRYYQTEARKMLKPLNTFRTTKKNQWFYSQSGSKIRVKPKKLKYDYRLEKVAMQRLAEISADFSHTRPNGRKHSSLKPGKYRFMQENISYQTLGFSHSTGGTLLIVGKDIETSAAGFVDFFKETNENYDGQSHRRNMLNPSHKSVGCAVGVVGNTVYCVMEFGDKVTGKKTAAVNKTKKVKVKILAKNVDLKDSEVYAGDSPYSIENLAVKKGSSVKLPAMYGVLDIKGGSAARIAPASVKWKSSDSGAVKVSGGRLYGLKPTEEENYTVITATVKFLGVTRKHKINIYVYEE